MVSTSQSVTAHNQIESSVTPASRPRLAHVHNLRGLAIMFIVITHCLSVFDWSASPILEMVLKRIVANGTIFFLFIGGFLFEHLAVEYRPLPYLITKFKFVVVPYIVTSIPALLVFTVFSKRDGMSSGFYLQPIWLQVSEFLLTGTHLAPFWFIPTIIVFYLASPLIYMSFRRRSAYLVLPFLFLIPIFVPRGDADPLQSFVHFLPIWVLGMACSRFSEIASRALMRWFWWLLAAALALLLAEMALTEGTHSWYSDLGKAVFALRGKATKDSVAYTVELDGKKSSEGTLDGSGDAKKKAGPEKSVTIELPAGPHELTIRLAKGDAFERLTDLPVSRRYIESGQMSMSGLHSMAPCGPSRTASNEAGSSHATKTPRPARSDKSTSPSTPSL